MSEITDVLGNYRRLRAALRGISSTTLIEYKEKLESLIEEVQLQEEAVMEEQKERFEQIEKIKAIMAESNITEADLIGETVPAANTKKRPPRPAKYKFMVGNEEKTWTGQGRTPKALQDKLNAGHSLEEFLF